MFNIYGSISSIGAFVKSQQVSQLSHVFCVLGVFLRGNDYFELL